VPVSVAPATCATASVKKGLNARQTQARQSAAIFLQRFLENIGSSQLDDERKSPMGLRSPKPNESADLQIEVFSG
jgi:hypothetical protein